MEIQIFAEESDALRCIAVKLRVAVYLLSVVSNVSNLIVDSQAHCLRRRWLGRLYSFRRRGFKITEEVAEHCKNLFKRVAKKKNFGNGRFVRTLLEQAWLKQAQRIVKKTEDDSVTKEDLTSFVVEDFDVNVDKKYKNERKLGFTR